MAQVVLHEKLATGRRPHTEGGTIMVATAQGQQGRQKLADYRLVMAQKLRSDKDFHPPAVFVCRVEPRKRRCRGKQLVQGTADYRRIRGSIG
jgi:hypothetical protein